MSLLLPLASVPLVAGAFGLHLVAFCLAALAAFVAHEPALIWMGRRGAARARTLAPIVRPALVLLVLLAALFGSLALLDAARLVWLACLPSLILGALVFLLALRGRERNLPAELLAVLSLAALTVPGGLLAGLRWPTALQLAGAWAIALGLGTAGARSVLIRKKDGGRGLRVAMMLAIAVAVVGAVLLATRAIGPWLALGPFTFALVIVVLGCSPPSPKRMTQLGFGLTAACVLTLVGVVTGLR